ncbi:MAG TPA: AAA family ATPase [Acidimicrobiales bacterium]|nr:AAA family ATPase [Acidimicrobiales bacterium]
MRLTSLRVQMFRNIVDSGDVSVEDTVTCLVGKNEAGKSAILQALHFLNPANPIGPLVLLDEYPRWLLKEHQISDTIKDARPIAATFELNDSEKTAIDAKFGSGILGDSSVTFYRTYVAPNEIHIEIAINFGVFTSPIIDALSDDLKQAVGAARTTTELTTAFDAVIAARDQSNGLSVNLSDEATASKANMAAKLGGHTTLTSAIRAELISDLPSTFYFSNYAQLQGRYSVSEIFAAIQNGSDDPSIQSAANFLSLANIAPTSVETWNFEESNAELEGISSLLTKRVKELWHQNDHLKLRVSLETQPANPQGQVQKFLQFRVEDTRHDFTSRLDRRSTGFQWFVSFIASFLDFESTRNLILLLDEPGLSLHARAQMDLLDTINDRLAADRQVLYSTHSPFMVRVNELNHARITEDQGPKLGSVVINDAGAVTDPDTLFPLQAALGYDIAQSLFIGDQNVIVEGISDFIYILSISAHLEANGRNHLSNSTRIIPAGGATNIPTFIALIGNKLDVVILLDGNTNYQRIEEAIKRGRLDQPKLLSIDTFSLVSKADIEDLFEPAEYLDFYNATFGDSIALGDLKGSDRVVKRIERFKKSDFNHGIVGAYFLRNLDASIAKLSASTIDRFEKLIDAINAAL